MRWRLLSDAGPGIGFETARALAAGGARLIITGRDPRRGRRAAEEIAAETGSPMTFLPADVVHRL